MIGFFLWYLSGEAVLGITKRSFTGWMRAAAALWLGISIFVGVSYGAALLSIRWILLPVMLSLAATGGAYFWKSSRRYLTRDWHGPHWFLISFAILFSLSVTTSGWFVNGALALRGVNAVDGIWNLALAEELKHTFPPEHPAIAGVPLRGYHFLYNLLIADFSRLTRLSTIELHFHFIPIVMSFLLVYGLYALALRLTEDRRHAAWATFFALAGGSFAFVLPIFFGRAVSLDDALGITQPFSLLVSPSFVLSLLSIIYTWIFLDEYTKHPSLHWGVVIGVLAGLSVGMKVYAGMILLPTIGWFVLTRLIQKRKGASLIIAIAAGLSAAAVFLPLNASYGFLRYQPLWPPHRVMQGVLDFTRWELKRQTLEAMGARLGLFKLEVIALVIFVFGNLGTRIIGLMGLSLVKKKDISILFSFLIIGSLVSFILPMFFLQPIGAFNMIQFFWYFLVFMGLLAGWGFSLIILRLSPPWREVIVAVILIATLPSAVEKINLFVHKPTPFISPAEMTFYQKLRMSGKPGDVVLVVPAIDRYTEADIQGWFYSTGPTIPALTSKRTFLGSEVVQFPYDEWIGERVKLLNIFLLGFNDRLTQGEKQAEALKQLQILQEKYSIDSIVVPKGAQPWFIGRPWLRFLFANDYAAIYQVHGLPE
ncbi:hypothetical protein HY339_00505 [Candidatus Gottesmanbacteria bacterium]|nr:hypothetical protein [Candidatus Gottesmanbacteria bacterium]